VTTVTKDMVRYGAAVFACTQGEFVERAVAEYLKHHAELVQRRATSVSETAESLTK
jgi:glutamate racemase